MSDYAAARLHMVQSQILPNNASDPRVAEALQRVPRELFVPARLNTVAYLDEDIEVAPGRYLMEPLVYARLLQAAAVETADVVLDVGCTSGYSAAVLADLAASVVALESDAELAARASQTLADLGADNAVVVEGDLAAGIADQGPYDVIILNGAVTAVPEALTGQLAEGGRLAAVVEVNGVGRIRLLRRQNGNVSGHDICDAQVPALPGFAPKAGFSF
ncbi:MAG TPA: protein-L-isoaspartate O-methyltransferase [Alphaproteobacteria bacterium]|jgi:protein-L-isoaspartate(D-aspartate) O-methyltransferase|nr:protein-L-isoaspartate O-methyltransferase [Alphaproteobacteria bacterium]MDP6271831.1 protein-L-isoaspartate O-methyltransferase [Alphaproteobacteria bacterium]MDP7428644.1 protein-L-isoaspartate O-methyltransferase [Alphaproteobacteria bacterium]HJM50568.1 protein-L-isoaspartate O-methyltransferase [Alphaproteobacteria bacterium]